MAKKVLHLLSSTAYSGAENMVCQIVDMFKNEMEMGYCSPTGEIEEFLFEREIKYIPIGDISPRNFKQIIDEYAPDIIHAHDIRASVVAACCFVGVPIISHIHGKFEDMSRVSLRSILYRICTKRFKHIIVVSESIIDEYCFSRSIKHKSSVLYNIVQLEVLASNTSGRPNKIFDCVYLGRFTKAKDPIRLIYILAKIIARLPNIKVVLIGDGVLLSDAKKLAEKLNISQNITFTGFLKEPYEILKSSKIMLMSSKSEGTPMSVLEAMLSKVPIVSTAVDGIKELIHNGVNGFCYSQDEQIVNVACELIEDDNLREAISENAYCKALVINNVVKYKNKLLDIYEDALAEKKKVI